MIALRSALLGGLALAAAIGGCNAILDNQPGKPKDPALTSDEKGPGGEGAPRGDTRDPGGPPATSECAPSAHLCGGACVALDDPAYGCGSADCEPCAVEHGQATCGADGCAIEACDPGFADCNGRADDGCEVDLSRATSCGACDATCPASRPVCAPSADTFACTTGCTPAAPLLCGDECVSPFTSPKHCGDCGIACPDVANGTPACVNGACVFTCKAGFQACEDRCVVPTDPTACGPACLPCPVPPHATATCIADTCGIRCSEGYGDCNRDAADGCETDLRADPRHCGACGKPCDAGQCKDGVCAAAPEGPRGRQR